MEPIGILYGAIGGIIIGASGYLKGRELSKFDWVKFGPIVVLSGLSGFLTAGYGLPGDYLTTTSIGGFIGLLVENAVKFIKRRFFTKTMK